MTDRELLERAARAAGIVGSWEKDTAFIQERYYFNVPYDNQNMLSGFRWDPLNDDGDALRLAVKLGICFGPNFDGDLAVCFGLEGRNITEPFGDDPASATRRAIVRSAASAMAPEEAE